MNSGAHVFPSTIPSGDTLADSLRAWYCLRVTARREHVAAVSLIKRTGLRTFAPRIRSRKSARSGECGLATEALFPGYIFARFRYPHEARHVASTPGVLGLVAFGGTPPAVRDEVINFLDAEVRGAESASPTPAFEEGAWVRIVAGCFRGSEGRVVQGGPAALRICVLMNLLGQDVQISVPAGHLTGLGQAQNYFPAGLRNQPCSPSPIAQ